MDIDYNKEPVHFCKNCGSLYVLVHNGGTCGDCGCNRTGKCSIEVWIDEYERQNGEQYVKTRS